MESQCLSINVGPHIKGRVLCELSDSDHTSYPYDIKPREGFTYTGTEVTKLSRMITIKYIITPKSHLR